MKGQVCVGRVELSLGVQEKNGGFQINALDWHRDP